MVFDGDANNQDICSLADILAKTDNTDFPLTEKAIFASMGEREVMTWIFSVYGGWIYDDRANSDFPSATTALANGQTNYALPNLLTLKGVSYRLQNSDTWEKLTPITLEEIQDRGYAEPEFERVPGSPRFYRPIGNSIKIYPAANFDQNASIQTEFDRDTIGFTPSSDTRTPGFAPLFHESLATFMAMMFAEINTLESATALRRAWDGNEEVTKIEGGWKKKIKSWYRSQYKELNAKIEKGRSDVVNQYI